MTEQIYTKLSDLRTYYNNPNGLVSWLHSVNNCGVTNGDIHLSVIAPKCPQETDGDFTYLTLYELKDPNTNTSISIQFGCYTSHKIWNDDPLSKLVFDWGYLGSSNVEVHGRGYTSVTRENGFTIHGRVKKTVGTTTTILYNPQSGVVYNGAFDFDFPLAHWNNYFGYTPSNDTLELKCYCQRLYTNITPREGLPNTGNTRYTIINETYNLTSWLRNLDRLEYYIDGYNIPLEETDGDSNSYFYDCYTYSDNFAQTAKTLVYHKWGKIKTPTGCRVWGVVDDNLPYNVKLHVTSGYHFMGAIQNDGTYTDMTSLDVRITARKTVNDGNGVYYYGALSTNIPIFDNDSDGDHYGETGDDSTSIYDDVLNGSTTHRFGELITKTQTASYNLPSHGRPYYNVNTHIAELIGWISSERVQSIFADFTLWGNNPIDMVCDFYWTPLDLLALGYTHSGPHFIQFGYIYAEDLTSSASEPYTKLTCNNAFHSLMGTEYTLVNEVISGVYNDWRDYELFKFKLYLPFMGTIDLPPHLIINKTLKVTIKYFISTHTLHYYVYVDNVVAYEYDVIVGCDVPLTGADVVGKARQNLSAYGADYGHFASMGASAVRGDFVGAVSSGIGLMTNKIMRDSATSLSTWGTQSVTGNICDYGSCYMVIEEQQHYAPPKLHDMYNYPSYYIGTIGSCSGYCEIENVKLSGMGSFSESEKNKVKELLRNGVIL